MSLKHCYAKICVRRMPHDANGKSATRFVVTFAAKLAVNRFDSESYNFDLNGFVIMTCAHLWPAWLLLTLFFKMSLYLKQGINLFDTPLRKQKLHDLKKQNIPRKVCRIISVWSLLCFKWKPTNQSIQL